ncbi:MAG: hypothetical protein GY722_04590 [bacterium]|nr:hypothetical protein [bacterium]
MSSQIAFSGPEDEHENADWWRLRAVYDKTFETSKTPLLVDAESPTGERATWVLKPRSRLANSGSIKELIGCRLARLLSVETPDFGVIDVTENVVLALSTGRREMLAGSIGPNFGSRFCEGLSDLTDVHAMPPLLTSDAVNLFGCDVISDNADRNEGRSNMLLGDDRLLAIDHEMMFSWYEALGVDGYWIPDILYRLQREHFFGRSVSNWGESFAQLRERFESVDVDDLETLVNDVPNLWLDESGTSCLSQIKAYIGNLLERREDIVDQMDRGVFL